MVNNTTVGKPELGDRYTVDKVNGDWLWIKSRGGYLKRSDVVLDEEAIDYFTRRINANASSANYSDRAVCWRKRGELEIALGDFNEAIRLDPTSASAYNSRGVVWFEKDDYDKAIADYNEAIRLDPKHAAAYNNRSNAWHEKGDYDKAIADCNEAIRLDAKLAMAYNNRSYAWCKKGDYDKAIADGNEAIRLDPKYALAFINRGNAWIEIGDYDKAIADCNEAIRLDPKYATAYNNRAWYRATCPNAGFRDGAQAVRDATKACELTDWKDASCINTLSAALAEAGKFEEAIQRLQQAIDLNPKHDKEVWEKMMAEFKAGRPYRVEPAPSSATR
jgi:tetratricopeptide (TPR) repeat protein